MTTDLDKQPRSTQSQMQERRQHVLAELTEGEKSIKEMFDGTPWTYAQAMITLRKMLADHEIVQVGKNGREVLFALASSNPHVLPPVSIAKIIDHLQRGQNELHVVSMSFVESDGLVMDLKFPDGEVVSAHLVA